MLNYKFKGKKNKGSTKRSWPYTLIAAFFALLLYLGIFMIWNNVDDGDYSPLVVAIAPFFIAVALTFAAVNGRRHYARDLLSLISDFIWRP